MMPIIGFICVISGVDIVARNPFYDLNPRETDVGRHYPQVNAHTKSARIANLNIWSDDNIRVSWHEITGGCNARHGNR